MNSIVDIAPPVASYGTLDRFLRERLRARLAPLRDGTLRCHDALGVFEIVGAGVKTTPIDIEVHDPAFYRSLAMHGSVGAADAYIDGAWDTDDLVGLVRLLVRNRDLLDGFETGSARVGALALRAMHALRRNTREGSRRNIAAHYDLGNDFFGLFLDDNLMYSSALYANVDDSLETASRRKLDRICRKLDLKPGDRVVEIGTGWGGFALHAAKHYRCHVTTTTISAEQHAAAAKRIADAGLSDRVDLLRADYRDLSGTFDKLASIEMVEAVGAEYLDTFFAKVEALLKPDGRALIQAITIEDHRYEQALHAVDFIKARVFPGSFIPSIAALLSSKTRSGELALVHLEDFGGSYARTLAAWRARFHQARQRVLAQGYDERFLRLWDFYLAYCEGGFRERAIGVAQLLFDKPGSREAAPVAVDDRIEA